ncbi:hypothetical protein [Mesonia aquimarina]|uniref:hypothetical protein n=1 Tax=Mesonia aquimarina TaxID=1504967 RepID=UPI0013CF04C0|nr:hypothetical protein [Mesonia aquimarina]
MKILQTVPILIMFLAIIIGDLDMLSHLTKLYILLPLIPVSVTFLVAYKRKRKTEVTEF